MKRVIVLAAAFLLLLASPAFAHVSANPSELPAGGFGVITFRVPNETADANTTSVKVVFPESAPFAGVSVKPLPGWDYKVETAKLAKPLTNDDGETIEEATSAITWSGGEIKPGEFQEFQVSVGPVPDVDKLEFKAVQTYDNGDVVRWIDPVVEGQDEPENPAPTITVTHGDSGSSGDEAAASSSTDDGADGTSTATFAALALGGVALIAAVAALVMGRKRIPS